MCRNLLYHLFIIIIFILLTSFCLGLCEGLSNLDNTDHYITAIMTYCRESRTRFGPDGIHEGVGVSAPSTSPPQLDVR